MKGRKPKDVIVDKQPVDEVLDPPEWMGENAKDEWRRVMPALVQRKTMTDADLGSLESYCVARGRYVDIETQIVSMMSKMSSDNKAFGIPVNLHRMQCQAMTIARQLAAELGLTPVSRSRPSIREDDSGDDLLC